MYSRLSNQYRYYVTALAVLSVGCGFSIGAARCAAQDEFQLYRDLALAPYRPAIRFVWEADESFSAEFRARVERDVRRRIRDCVGEYWSPEYSSTILADASRLELRRETLKSQLDASANDKVILATIRREGHGVRVAACEWDQTTLYWSAVVQRETLRDEVLPAAVVLCVRDAFRPLFRIIDTDGDDVRMIALAGEILPPDSSFAPIQPETLSQPAIVYYDRKQVRQRTQHLPLTYIYAGSRERGYVQGTTISAFRAALGGARRNRVELWSLGGRPSAAETRIKLIRQDDPSRVLMGERVVVSPRVFLKEDPREEPQERLSDRDGFVSIAAHAASPIVWLYVWSGDALLARVPYAPGWETETSVALPDDSIRLRVEGQLERLKGDLTETVARRAVLKAQALAAAKNGDKVAAGNLKSALIETRKITARLTDEVAQIRESESRNAEKAGQRVAVIRIKKACDSLDKIIRSYLDPDRVREAVEEIDSLLQVAP